MRRGVLRIGAAAYRRINRKSTLGLGWEKQGDAITFKWRGFVAAPSIPLLFARHHYESAVIRSLLQGRAIGRSLEIGCGFGRLSPVFASVSSHHVGVDINDKALDMARTAYPHLEFEEASVTSLPFPDDSFDLVTSWTVVQHVPPTMIDQALAEVHRVVRPTGCLLLCEETRNPEEPTRHSWHRTPDFYAARLAPFRLTQSFYIEEIDRLPELTSPGEVMLFDQENASAQRA